ncbi:uncharacterized protein LOC117643472 [Thrips palmi]|uniref:Uncharacterized protein LOC117643472 n=1 Tax=Thrips palmi TaxID=161013 RepID=A0A6P8ZL60_THRPL|nr:uncharacterized protein LOC117643472 [Thrips palmi]
MWVRFALFGLVATLALAAAKTDLETEVEALIETFRGDMKTGRPDIGIPVLEPAVIKQIPVNIKLSPFDASCVASDINIARVSGFEFTRLEQLAGTTKLAVSVKLPDIAVDGEYDLKGRVKVGFINVKLNGKGPLKLTLKGLKGDATVDVIVNGDGSLNVADLKIDSWTYDKISINLENLLDGGVMGKTVNKLINKLVPTFVNANRAKINGMIETMGKKVINQYLDGVAGKLSLLHGEATPQLTLDHQNWIVPAEVQEILHQLAAAASSSSSSLLAKTDLETEVEAIIETFRGDMKTGRPDIGIPVLEPAVIKQIPVNIKLSPFDASCVASDINIARVSGFEFTRLEQLAGTTKLAVSVKLPDIAVDGEYDLKGRVKVGFINVKLNGKGPLKLTLKGLKGDATVDVIVNGDGSLNVADLKIDSWTYDKISINLENLLDGGVMGKTVNKLINKLVPTFVNANRAKINGMIETMGKKVINQYLDGVAGKLSLLHGEAAPQLTLDHQNWIVPAEVQEILHQLAAAASSSSSSSLVPRVLQLLEDFRKMMRKGRPDMSIPVLEPAVIHTMPVEINLPPFDASAVSRDVHVSGVSAFVINKLEQVDGTNRLSVAIEVPEVDVDGQYEINGKVKIGFLDFNLSGGKGPVTLKMKGFKGTATIDMIVNDDDSLNLNWIRFDTWNFDKVEANLENVAMAKYVNPLINKLIPVFLQLNRAWINNWGEGVAQTVVNRYLDGIAGKTVHSAFPLNEMAVDAAPLVVSLEAQQLLDQLALILTDRPRLAAALAA